MDIITNNICDTYMAVYDRVPDLSELSKHALEYRARIASVEHPSELNRGVECALVSSLEFHDVLKNKLKQKYVDARQDTMSAAALYGTLERALQQLHALPLSDRTVSNVDGIVHTCVTDLPEEKGNGNKRTT